MNLKKDDFQSKEIYDSEGVAPSIYAGEKRYGGDECYVLVNCWGFSTEHSAKSRSIGAGEEVSPTLRAGVVPAIAYEI